MTFRKFYPKKRKLYSSATREYSNTLRSITRELNSREEELRVKQVKVFLSNLKPDERKELVENILKRKGLSVSTSDTHFSHSDLGTRIDLSNTDDDWKIKGVAKFSENSQTSVLNIRLSGLDIARASEVSLDEHNWQLSYNYSDIRLRNDRRFDAIGRFERLHCSSFVHRSLLGSYDDQKNIIYDSAKIVSHDSLKTTSLDKYQTLAIEESMRKRINLIEGCAGSGKTMVAANIAYSTSRLRKNKVLICSPYQSTVNEISRLLKETRGAKVVKLSEGTIWGKRPMVRVAKEFLTNGDDCSLDRLVSYELFEKFSNRPESARLVNHMIACCSGFRRRKTEEKILKDADIVCCTLLQAGEKMMMKLKFDMLVIDDADSVHDVDALIPITSRGLEQITLIGDMRQVLCKSLKSTKRRRFNHQLRTRYIEPSKSRVDNHSLFERWLSMGLTAIALGYQYRMHESLATFLYQQFYKSKVKNCPKTNEDLKENISSLLSQDPINRLHWVPSCSNHIMTSLINISSDRISQTCEDIVHDIQKRTNMRISIVVNRPEHLIDKKIRILTSENVKIGTVSDFYSRQEDFIILVARQSAYPYKDEKEQYVKAMRFKHLDFLVDDTALKIAITRARLGVFIIADLQIVGEDSEQGIWTELVKIYRQNEWIIDRGQSFEYLYNNII